LNCPSTAAHLGLAAATMSLSIRLTMFSVNIPTSR